MPRNSNFEYTMTIFLLVDVNVYLYINVITIDY